MDDSYYPASHDSPACPGWSNVIQAGDSDLPLTRRRDMLLPMTELTDTGDEMKLSNIGMQDDEFNTLTSVVIFSDCQWAINALTER